MKNPVIQLSPVNWTTSSLEPAADSLRHGGLVIYPTETVYGLGAAIYSEKAVQRVFEIKGRDEDKPISVMIAAPQELAELCPAIPSQAEALIEAFWPGPLTLVLPAGERMPDHLKGRKNAVGVRCPDHDVCNALVKLAGQPLTSTSANFSGEPAPVSVADIPRRLREGVDFVLDSGTCRERVPSTVVDVTSGTPQLLREGAIPFTTIIDRIERKAS